jgi:tetratricopeptide (TPR) repeat protein|tara:strand:- start:200 stop:883 length:684 start_codon:yes stop_codon:yes gene_type:complete
METLTGLEKSLGHFQKENDRLKEAETYMKIGHFFLNDRKWPRAASSFKKSLEIFEEHNQIQEQGQTLAYLGLVTWEQAQVQKAIEFFKLSLKMINEIGDNNARGIVEAILGLSLWRKGDWTESLAVLKEVLPMDLQLIPEAYKALHFSIERATSLVKNRIPAAQMNNNPLRIMQGHFTLVPLLLYMGNIEETTLHIKEAESFANQLKDEKVLQMILKLRELIGSLKD